MSVVASRSAHSPSRSASSGRSASSARPAVSYGSPTLRITVDVPLDRDMLPTQAARLLELVRELARQPLAVVDPPADVEAEPPGATVLRHPAADARGWAAPRLRVLVGQRIVLLDEEPVPLTRLEFDLLSFLATHPRRVFSRRQLLRSVWQDDLGVSRTVDVHVRRLRAKLGPDVPVVTTVYGVGYRLAEQARIAVHEGPSDLD